MIQKKSMKLGNNVFLILLFYIFFSNLLFSEEKIVTTPLINIDEIKPSFEELDDQENFSSNKSLKEKKNVKNINETSLLWMFNFFPPPPGL